MDQNILVLTKRPLFASHATSLYVYCFLTWAIIITGAVSSGTMAWGTGLMQNIVKYRGNMCLDFNYKLNIKSKCCQLNSVDTPSYRPCNLSRMFGWWARHWLAEVGDGDRESMNANVGRWVSLQQDITVRTVNRINTDTHIIIACGICGGERCGQLFINYWVSHLKDIDR